MTKLKNSAIIGISSKIKRCSMKTKDLILISLFTALTAVGAFIRIPVPVCPFTLQLLFTTLAGVLLAGGGGISYVFQPTFGYLIGFIVGAFVTGAVAHSSHPSMKRLLTGCFLGLAIVYALGMLYYWLISRFWLGDPIGIAPLFLYCFVLAVPGDICLCILASILGKKLLPVINKQSVRSV